MGRMRKSWKMDYITYPQANYICVDSFVYKLVVEEEKKKELINKSVSGFLLVGIFVTISF
jgi:uncharacterized membrane protein YkvI